MTAAAFWLLLTLLAYLHEGYALCLWVVALLRPRSRVSESPGYRVSDEIRPSITILVGAYNEEESLAGKLDSLLEQDYEGVLDLMVVSDMSTDGTHRISHSYQPGRSRQTGRK